MVKTNFKMEQIPYDGYEELMNNQINLLMPSIEEMELPEEAAQDAYSAVTDSDKDRMCYVTGKKAMELYNKRQELGDEGFRRYLKEILIPGK